MRVKWIVLALAGWLPGLDLAALDAEQELRRREPAAAVRHLRGAAGLEGGSAHSRAIDRERHGRTIEGRQFLVWDEDPRTAEQWAAELRPLDRPG